MRLAPAKTMTVTSRCVVLLGLASLPSSDASTVASSPPVPNLRGADISGLQGGDQGRELKCTDLEEKGEDLYHWLDRRQR